MLRQAEKSVIYQASRESRLKQRTVTSSGGLRSQSLAKHQEKVDSDRGIFGENRSIINIKIQRKFRKRRETAVRKNAAGGIHGRI